MSLLKMQIPAGCGINRVWFLLFSVGLATIGVCIFGAAYFGSRTFLFYLQEEKHMKKIIALILTALMLFSLVACKDEGNDEGGGGGGSQISGGTNNGGSGNGGSGSGTGSGGTSGGGTEGGGTGSGGTSSKEKIDLTKITSSTAFSEGKAWVRYGQLGKDEYNTAYCINKEGKILFSINNAPGCGVFYNGLSQISLKLNPEKDWETTDCLCDENGNITKPADLGATEFLASSDVSKAFQDGYVFAVKVETSFSGSTTKIAVFDSDMNKIIDYSEDIMAFFNTGLGSFDCEYNNGFLCLPYDDKYLDLKTNQIKNKTEYLIDSAPERASDAWEYDSWEAAYYDPFTDAKTLDLSQYKETIYGTFTFDGGRAPLVFKSADIYYFTIIKEDGSFCFEPMEISTFDCRVERSGTKYLVVSSANWDKRKYQIFDENGMMSELEIDISNDRYTYDFFNEDALILERINNQLVRTFYFYTLNFEPLF